MGTQLILTVGTNPLPVWVAWYHLKEKLQPPIKVRLVHTAGTVDEKKCLEICCRECCRDADFLSPIKTSAGDPKTIRGDIGIILKDLDGINNLHVHYTGGTKVIAVETVVGIKYSLPENINLDTSYLDPRGSSGPIIRNSNGENLVEDTRKNINANIKHIAKLNGVEFKEVPKCLSNEKLNQGSTWINNGWPDTSDGGPLEYGAYAAFKQALSRRARERKNYALYHSLKGSRIKKSKTPRPFELDVVAVLGYQVVVVSCSGAVSPKTANDVIKLKAMEAIVRAKQLGGDEARALMLCKLDNRSCQEIEAGLEDDMGDENRHLKIWGKTSRHNKLPDMDGLTHKFDQYLKDLAWE